MKSKITATTYDDTGKEVKKNYKLSDFATMNIEDSVNTIKRKNLTQYLSVTAEVEDGYNATLMSRELEKKINEYNIPDGYTIDATGYTFRSYFSLPYYGCTVSKLIVTVYYILYNSFGIYRRNDRINNLWPDYFSHGINGIYDPYGNCSKQRYCIR